MIMRGIIINVILIPSLKRLYQEDYDNIRLVNKTMSLDNLNHLNLRLSNY